MKKDITRISIVLLLTYLLQFVIAPTLFPIYYPSTNESTAILFGSISVGALLGMIFLSDKYRYWLLCDIPYFLLMILYSHNGAYGIGVVGIPIDGNQVYYDRGVAIFLVLYIAVLTFLIQLIVWIIVKLLKWIAKLISCASAN